MRLCPPAPRAPSMPTENAPALPASPPHFKFLRRPFTVPKVSDAPQGYALTRDSQTIRATVSAPQKAQMLRFLFTMRGHSVDWDALSQAINGSHEVSRCIDSLRGLGIPILCQHKRSPNGKGTFGVYWLGEGVEPWSPVSARQSGEA